MQILIIYDKILRYLKEKQATIAIFFKKIYLTLPISVGILINVPFIKNYLANKVFLSSFIFVITILYFILIISVYYYNLSVFKDKYTTIYSKITHLKRVLYSYFYIIFLFGNLFYVSHFSKSIFIQENNLQTTSYFNFKEDYNYDDYGDSMTLFLNSIYLSVATVTSTGYGDIVPNSVYGRFLVSIEALLGQITIGLSMVLWVSRKEQ